MKLIIEQAAQEFKRSDLRHKHFVSFVEGYRIASLQKESKVVRNIRRVNYLMLSVAGIYGLNILIIILREIVR